MAKVMVRPEMRCAVRHTKVTVRRTKDTVRRTQDGVLQNRRPFPHRPGHRAGISGLARGGWLHVGYPRTIRNR